MCLWHISALDRGNDTCATTYAPRGAIPHMLWTAARIPNSIISRPWSADNAARGAGFLHRVVLFVGATTTLAGIARCRHLLQRPPVVGARPLRQSLQLRRGRSGRSVFRRGVRVRSCFVARPGCRQLIACTYRRIPPTLQCRALARLLRSRTSS